MTNEVSHASINFVQWLDLGMLLTVQIFSKDSNMSCVLVMPQKWRYNYVQFNWNKNTKFTKAYMQGSVEQLVIGASQS